VWHTVASLIQIVDPQERAGNHFRLASRLVVTLATQPVPLPQRETGQELQRSYNFLKKYAAHWRSADIRLTGYGKIDRKAVSGADRCLCPDVGDVHGNPRLKRRR
jgi:hypothetical protein